jgi:hypothetical protein
MTLALKKLQAEGMSLKPELIRAFSPLHTHHLNRFGFYELKELMPMLVDYGIKFNIA